MKFLKVLSCYQYSLQYYNTVYTHNSVPTSDLFEHTLNPLDRDAREAAFVLVRHDYCDYSGIHELQLHNVLVHRNQ